jgi:hypothetical protein
MFKVPVGCFRIMCYGWIIAGIAFILGLNRNGENLTGAGFLGLVVGLIGLYMTRSKD